MRQLVLRLEPFEKCVVGDVEELFLVATLYVGGYFAFQTTHVFLPVPRRTVTAVPLNSPIRHELEEELELDSLLDRHSYFRLLYQ